MKRLQRLLFPINKPGSTTDAKGSEETALVLITRGFGSSHELFESILDKN
jgi:hypothetical protein